MTPSVGNDSITQDQFLQLFVTQLSNQNPLEPMDNTEFMNQVSMSTLVEQTTKISESFDTLLTNSSEALNMSTFNQATALIGNRVTFTDAGSGLSAEGVVDGVSLEGGYVHLEIGDQLVLPSAVTAVRSS